MATASDCRAFLTELFGEPDTLDDDEMSFWRLDDPNIMVALQGDGSDVVTLDWPKGTSDKRGNLMVKLYAVVGWCRVNRIALACPYVPGHDEDAAAIQFAAKILQGAASNARSLAASYQSRLYAIVGERGGYVAIDGQGNETVVPVQDVESVNHAGTGSPTVTVTISGERLTMPLRWSRAN